MSKPILWVFARIEALWPNQNRPQTLIANCERFKAQGYNGLHLWDSNLSRPVIEAKDQVGYRLLNDWCLKNDWTLGAQVFPQGAELLRWPGTDNAILERGGEYLCLGDGRVHSIYERIVKNVTTLFPEGSALRVLMAYYDEIRQHGTHNVCKRPGGEMLAAHAKRTIEIVREHAPHLTPGVWNDMFDPFHNAVTPYRNYPVLGGWKNSWQGIDPGVLIHNWMTPNKDTSDDDSFKSFSWWAERGNQQVFQGYYDGPTGDGSTAQHEEAYIRRVQTLPKQIGFCYTTWKDNLTKTGEYLVDDGWDPFQGPTAPVPPVEMKTCPTCLGTGKVPA